MIRLLPKNTKKLLLVTDKENRRYFSGKDFSEGVVIVSSTRLVYFADSRYISAVKNAFSEDNAKVEVFESKKTVVDYLNALGEKSVLTDFRKISVSSFNEYKELGLRLKNGAKLIDKLRVKKSAEEIKNISKACEIIESALEKTLPFIKEGVTELAVKEELVKNIKLFGGETESFESIVAFGVNSAVPHHQTGETVLEKESVVLIDTGATYKGYKSDITRTYYYGKAPSEKFMKTYQAVLSANIVAEEKITAGVSGKQADAYAREFLEKENLAEYFTHSLGHGVGLEIHENIRLNPKSVDTLKNGYTFTVEPGVYIEGEFGVRIEDTVVMKGGKVKRLTKSDKNLKKL